MRLLLYVPVFTLSINNNIIFLKIFKKGLKRIISWNKYRSEIMTKHKNNNINCMIDPAFKNFNRFFFQSFKNGDDDAARNSFDRYYMRLVEIKPFFISQ